MRGPTDEMRVLLVDDETNFSKTVASFLEHEDDRLAVQSTSSADGAMDILAREDIDCIVSDYQMQGMDGIDLLEWVRDEYPTLPFILYTGKGSETIASEAITSGVTEYLQKEPTTSHYAVLANRIRNSVENYRAQTDLANREQRLSLFFEQSPFGVIEWNENFEFVRQNAAGKEILGYSEEDLKGESWKTIVPESDRAGVEEVVSGLLENRDGFQSINKNIRKDGEIIVCEWHNRVITDEAGDVVAILSQFLDITDQRERERELERYEAYLMESNDIITVLDSDGTIMYESPSVERILGYEPEELIGLTRFELTHPDDREMISAAFEYLLANPSETVTTEARFKVADGEWRWLESRGTNHLENDPINGIISNNRDITERKEFEEGLRAERERFEQVLETSPVGIVILDNSGNIIQANDRAEGVLGLVRTEIAARTYDDPAWSIVEKEGNPVPSEELPFNQVMDSGEKVFNFEHGIEWPDGRERWLSINAAPLQTEDGEIEQVVSVISDITDQREYEQTIERKNNRLEQFASVVSHDLRNPLTVAQGRLDLVQDEFDSDHLDHIEQALDRMQRLIDTILTLAKKGEAATEIEPVALRSIVEESWGHVDTGSASLAVETDQVLQADRNQLEQLLENLIRNSLDHGGDTVTVTVGPLEDGFFIADDGPGIPDDVREHIFEMGHTTSENGTGFGLSIVQEIADIHGWDIEVIESLQGGAKFEFTGVEFPDE